MSAAASPERSPPEPSWPEIEALFFEVLELDPGARARLLEERCAELPQLRAEVEALLAADRDAARVLTPPGARTRAAALDEVARAPQAPHGPHAGEQLGAWTLETRLGSGGMGEVWRARRSASSFAQVAALKLVQRAGDPRTLARFVQERRALARLEHPHIARLLDGGALADGRPYLVMELVDGEPIDRSCDARALGVRARLELFLEVCDAVDYAHRNLVVHRDLKPSNILVGADGRAKLLDFGIAKILADDEQLSVRTLEHERLLTPRYASPEQVRGEPISTSSDVYSLGVVLHELLSGAGPYPATALRTHELARSICEDEPRKPSACALRDEGGAPSSAPEGAGAGESSEHAPRRARNADERALGRGRSADERALARGRSADERALARGTTARALARELAGDLDAIVLMALRKEPQRRYASVERLAHDLRRHLAGQPVAARGESARYRLHKLVLRHRFAAASAALVVVTLVVAGVAVTLSARTAHARLSEVLRLADLKRLEDETAAAETLWPARPATVPAIEAWLGRARELAGHLDTHRTTLSELRARALPYDDEQARDDRRTHPRAEELASALVRRESTQWRLDRASGDPRELETRLADLDQEIERLTQLVAQRRTWRFAEVGEQWTHDKLAELVLDLSAFDAPESGLIARVEARGELSRSIAQTIGDEHAARWREACDAVGDPRRTPVYRGLALAPQLGLVPLGSDAASGLWEFADVQTGVVPQRDEHGRLRIDEATALVFVLLPAGVARMGSEPAGGSDASAADPFARADEQPVNEVALAPFFLSKFEMTQGQWSRVAGSNPSAFAPGQQHGRDTIDLRHPVEHMGWADAELTLGHLGFALPSEAQWEYATRAGTRTPWWTGAERETLAGAANIADASAGRARAPWPAIGDWPDYDDGYVVHAPVGSFRANPFGLHDVCGNVWEWCDDEYARYDLPTDPVNGRRLWRGSRERCGRGGSFLDPAASTRSAHRGHSVLEAREASIGLRPARAVE